MRKKTKEFLAEVLNEVKKLILTLHFSEVVSGCKFLFSKLKDCVKSKDCNISDVIDLFTSLFLLICVVLVLIVLFKLLSFI